MLLELESKAMLLDLLVSATALLEKCEAVLNSLTLTDTYTL